MSTKGFFMTSVLHRPTHRTRLVPVLTSALTLALVLTVGACSADTPSSPAAHETATTSAAVTMVDPWVKAADSGTTGVFGTISNARDTDVRLTAGTSPAAAKVELHEMAADASGTMVMRPKEGGFVVPAHGSLTLSPGGLHIMLMGLTAPVKPGDDVTVTLSADDGTTLDVTASARSFAGANESYSGTASPTASSMP
ncbi:MAG TPA: copper chaperone PCu(A)C [Cellulomonadaceae bacterium]|nr:copper chaperone PCu(A)C [Cellulomonadaceae bacterium]